MSYHIYCFFIPPWIRRVQWQLSSGPESGFTVHKGVQIPLQDDDTKVTPSSIVQLLFRLYQEERSTNESHAFFDAMISLHGFTIIRAHRPFVFVMRNPTRRGVAMVSIVTKTLHAAKAHLRWPIFGFSLLKVQYVRRFADPNTSLRDFNSID
jgi:hypothetical protein